MSSVMLAMLLLALPQPAAQETLNLVVTTGEAVVQRAPDRAFVTIASEARAKASRDAQRLNAEAMAAVQQRLAQAGIARDAIRTLGVDLQQEFDFPQGRRVPREYVARNAIEVRIDDLARVGDVLDAAVQAGATATSNVRFDLRDRSGAEHEALRLAVADARARAEAAVAGAGRSIDRIVKIEDSRESNVIVPRPMVAGFAKADATAAPTPVEAGTIEIRARVTLTASMK
ncbi:MAG TPA: SIMPL domain-containing protein [Vicinamibacterales bacterium]|nr:SIMPL domain-containing protein [Vicinamibacterales bacterium]